MKGGGSKVDKATEIRRAITQAMVIFSPFRDRQPGVRVGISRAAAHLIAESVFQALEGGGYLNTDPPVDRQIRITQAITEAMGNVGQTPGAYSPGQWYEVTPAPDLGEVTDAVYRNLVHWGYLTEETS